MKRDRIFLGITVALFLSFVSLSLYALEKKDEVPLIGRALFSFTPEHYMLQTDRYIYKISKKGLPVNLRDQLELAAARYQAVNLIVPLSSIEYLWPNQPSIEQEESAKRYNRMAKQMRSEALVKKGRFQLTGSSAFSFTEPVFMIEINQNIFQIKKSALSAEQVARLTNVGTGARVEISIPKQALEAVWSFRPELGGPATDSSELVDEIRPGDGEVTIIGRILYSFDDPLVLVQSKDIIYQIQKNRITTRNPKALDNVGAKVELTAPLDAVIFAWSARPHDVIFSAQPAGLR